MATLEQMLQSVAVIFNCFVVVAFALAIIAAGLSVLWLIGVGYLKGGTWMTKIFNSSMKNYRDTWRLIKDKKGKKVKG